MEISNYYREKKIEFEIINLMQDIHIHTNNKI